MRVVRVDGFGIEVASSDANRPPCLNPRERTIPQDARRALLSWAHSALNANATLEVTEWVSMDSRLWPHRVQFTWRDGNAWRVTSYFEKSEDLLASVVPRDLLLRV